MLSHPYVVILLYVSIIWLFIKGGREKKIGIFMFMHDVVSVKREQQ